MIRHNKGLVLFLLAALGLWGCARESSNDGREAQAIRALEAKVSQLEDEARTTTAAHDQLVIKLAAVEKTRALLQRQAQTLAAEGDELRLNVLARTTERDNMQAQYESFRKNLRTLLGQADAAATPAVPPPATARNQNSSDGTRIPTREAGGAN